MLPSATLFQIGMWASTSTCSAFATSRFMLRWRGETHREAGYELDVEPIELSEAEKALWWEWDGRSRAVRLDAPGGHIVFESYRDWLVEQRLGRKQKGIWSDKDITNEFPAGHPDEEVIVGFRAWKKWKEHFSIKRQYVKG